MGLGHNFACDLLELKRRGAMDGIASVIEIGAQQLSNSLLRAPDVIGDLFQLYDRPVPALGTAHFEGAINGVEHQPDDAPPSRLFWESLGFKYAALDFNGERDSIAVDLNRNSAPWRIKGTFDLAVNTGTTEHVANQENAFRMIHDLVRPGGIMMHDVPAQGMMTHGFFNYNPKFFWHLCRENGYEVLFLKVVSHSFNDVPANVLASNLTFSDCQHVSIEAIPDFMIRAAFRKKNGRRFVTPLDLPQPTKTNPAGLQRESGR
jgi:SAM-dependent methyltransferase